jgi:hypothetical protein
MRGMESHLFGFRKEIVRISVQNQFADKPDRHNLFRPKFGGIQYVDINFI